MERKIGEIFEFEGKKIEVKAAGNGCGGCFLKEKCCIESADLVGTCGAGDRTDKKHVVFVEVQEQPQEKVEQQQYQVEPPKLNLCEILKYCPNGELFWSPLLGDVKLYDIDEEAKTIDVTTKDLATWEINADGTITIDDITSEVIMLYPSREQIDWTKVKYKKKELPKTWQEFCEQNPIRDMECFLGNSSDLLTVGKDAGTRYEKRDKNILPSKQAAEAHLALMQLHQLRDCYRQGWEPNWEDNYDKHVIVKNRGEYGVFGCNWTSCFLTFQDKEIAEEFLTNFRDLIEQAWDLI